MMDLQRSSGQEVACLYSTYYHNLEHHHIAFMLNFEVLNVEVDWKKAEQKLLELFFN